MFSDGAKQIDTRHSMETPAIERVKDALDSLPTGLSIVQQELETETFSLRDLTVAIPPEIRETYGIQGDSVLDAVNALLQHADNTLTLKGVSVFQHIRSLAQYI